MKKGYVLFFMLLLNNTISLAVSGHTQYRFEALKPLLNNYERPWTYLELWADQGELASKIASKYNAVCIMTEFAQSDALFTLCKQNSVLKNLIAVKNDLSVQNLINLGDCEHVDFTFIPDVTSQYKEEWQEAIKAALNLGDYIAIEAPALSSVNHQQVASYLETKGGKLIANPPAELKEVAGSIYLFSIHKKTLLRRYWQYQKEIRLGEYTIKSTFKEKKLIKEKLKPKEYVVTDWIPGINLFTFKKLKGIWPERDAIIKMVLPFATIEHNDLRISNIIIQGQKLVTIDGDGKGHENTAAQLLPHLIEQLTWSTRLMD